MLCGTSEKVTSSSVSSTTTEWTTPLGYPYTSFEPRSFPEYIDQHGFPTSVSHAVAMTTDHIPTFTAEVDQCIELDGVVVTFGLIL